MERDKLLKYFEEYILFKIYVFYTKHSYKKEDICIFINMPIIEKILIDSDYFSQSKPNDKFLYYKVLCYFNGIPVTSFESPRLDHDYSITIGKISTIHSGDLVDHRINENLIKQLL